MRKAFAFFAVLALAALYTGAASAQELITSSGPIVSMDQELPTEETDEPREVPTPEAMRFVINDIRFTKSEILSEEELEGVARDFRGRELGLDDLKQIAARVNEIYRLKGIITAQALVPPQNISPGVATIRLVEGRLGKVQVKGNSSTEASYIVDRLGMKPGALMDLESLKKALIRFNKTNDAQLRCELAPGQTFGTTDIIVIVNEPQRDNLQVTYDSLGSPSTGRNRASLSFLNRSLSGLRDDYNFAITRAAGQYSLKGTYGFPLNAEGGHVDLDYDIDRTNIIDGSLTSLNIKGEAITREATLRQPIIIDAATKVEIVLGAKQRLSNNWSEDMLLQGIDTSNRSIGIEAQFLNKQSNCSVSYARSAVQSLSGDKESYLVDRGALRYNYDFTTDLSFRSSLTWQTTATKGLQSNDQLAIGGVGTVRGYQVGTYSGDSGYALNLELHHPITAANVSANGFKATGFFFVDRAQVNPYRPLNSSLAEHEALTGIGWGVDANWGKSLRAEVTLGYGLTPLTDQEYNYALTIQIVSVLI
jgi:hemolysin activation/secretion protein